jgi:hypothetical protein
MGLRVMKKSCQTNCMGEEVSNILFGETRRIFQSRWCKESFLNSEKEVTV